MSSNSCTDFLEHFVSTSTTSFLFLNKKLNTGNYILICQYLCNPIMSFGRLAKAEDDHQVAIAEKLDLEARLNEELEITKVSNVLKLTSHAISAFS